MVVHFLPAHRVVALLESLTGAAPSVGFVHGLLARTAGPVGRGARPDPHLDHPGVRGVRATRPRSGSGRAPRGRARRRPSKYLLVACTELYTHYLLGDRSLDDVQGVRARRARAARRARRARPLPELRLAPSSPGWSTSSAAPHLLRDLDDAAQVYPDAVWPVQIADALRELIHQANLARDTGRDQIDPVAPRQADQPVPPRRAGRAVRHPRRTAPAPASARPGCCWRCCATVRPTYCASPATWPCRPPPTRPNATCGPARCQQNISGRLTSEDRTRDRYTIRGYVSTAIKHGLNPTHRPPRRPPRPTLDARPTRDDLSPNGSNRNSIHS